MWGYVRHGAYAAKRRPDTAKRRLYQYRGNSGTTTWPGRDVIHCPRGSSDGESYCAYAGALLNYRRTLVHRWYCEHENRPEDEIRQTRLTAYDLRSVAREALFRARSLTPGEALMRHAWEALQRIDEVHRAADRDELDQRRTVTRTLVYRFVTGARKELG